MSLVTSNNQSLEICAWRPNVRVTQTAELSRYRVDRLDGVRRATDAGLLEGV